MLAAYTAQSGFWRAGRGVGRAVPLAGQLHVRLQGHPESLRMVAVLLLDEDGGRACVRRSVRGPFPFVVEARAIAGRAEARLVAAIDSSRHGGLNARRRLHRSTSACL